MYFRKLRVYAVAAVCFGAMNLGCGSDGPTGATPLIPVQLTLSPTAPSPASSVTVTVSATPDASDPLAVIRISVTGIATLQDSLVVTGNGGATFSRVIPLPLTIGALRIVGSVLSKSGRTGSTETSITTTDATPPSLSANLGSATTTTWQPGDTIRATIQANDDISLRYALIRATGAFTAVDSVTYTTRTPFASRSASVVVPATATLGSTVKLEAEIMDIGGNVVRTTLGTPSVNDVNSPSIVAQLGGAQPNGSYAPGTAAQVTVSATDNVTLKKIGVTVPGLSVGDSAALSASSGQLSLKVDIPANRTGVFPVLAFAVDGVGNRTQASVGVLYVDSRSRRAPVSSAIAGIRDIAFDDKRGVIYGSDPTGNRIVTISPSDASQLATTTLPGQPYGIDLTLSGDSLVAALRNTTNLGIVNLVSQAVSVVPLSTDTFFGQRPDNVRVASNGKVVYSLTFAGSGYGGSVKDLDLRTGASTASKSVTEATPLAASGNRQKVLGLVDDSCCPEEGFIYDANASRFTLSKGTVGRYFPGVAADYSGSTYLIGTDVFNGTLGLVKTVHATSSSASAVALSPDGATAYVSTATGVARIRISDDTVIETFSTGTNPVAMHLSSSGLTLAVATASRVYIIDLW